MKTITESINEARQISYRVAFLDVVDKEGLPVPATIMVDVKHQKFFEKYFEQEQDNTFQHACGGNVEY